MTKGLIGRRGKKSQQQQPEVQQVNVKVLDRQNSNWKSNIQYEFIPESSICKDDRSGGAKGISGVEEKLNLIKNLFAERFAYAKR